MSENLTTFAEAFRSYKTGVAPCGCMYDEFFGNATICVGKFDYADFAGHMIRIGCGDGHGYHVFYPGDWVRLARGLNKLSGGRR